jgi:DNA-3-methyladenine glycosylase
MDDGWHLNDKAIITTPRIGVAYAAEHALLPYRFYINNNKYVSGNKKDNFPL